MQYYLLAHNVAALSELHWVIETPLLKTLAAKHRSTTRKLRAKYKTTTRTPEGKPSAASRCACPVSTSQP